MKNVLICLTAAILSFSTVNVYGEISNSPASKKLPELNINENGQSFTSITSYMAKFVKYPEGANSFGLIGTAVAEFVITVDGQIKDIQIINSISYDIDQEIIRVLNQTNGKWVPGHSNGKIVQMKREVSVVFKPNKNYNLQTVASKSRDKAREAILSNSDAKKAIKNYTKAITIFPYELSFFAERGLCKYENGDVNGAKEDWNRIAYLNDYNPQNFNFSSTHIDPSFKSMKGVAQMKQILP